MRDVRHNSNPPPGTAQPSVQPAIAPNSSKSAKSERRPRLLWLGQTLPYPPDGGVHIRIFNVLRLLSRTFDITALCFYRRAERPTANEISAGIEGLAPYAKVVAFPIPQEFSRTRFIWDHTRSVCTGRAYTWYSYASRDFAAALGRTLQQERFDLVQIDSLDLAAYLPALHDIPVVCVHHNVESALLRRRATAERFAASRWYVRHQARLLERLERTWCGRVACNVAVSEVDQRALERLAPEARFVEVPNGVDVEAFRPEPGRSIGVVSVGGMNWFPNHDALQYFASDILPRIRTAVPAAPVVWVGRADAEQQRMFREQHGVELTGYVADIRPYVREAACFVVPLRVGGGTRLKILDAWAMGKAVVSTSVGCEGLAAVDGVNILIRDSADEFAAGVTSLLLNSDLRRRLGQAARETAEQQYSWEVIGTRMTQTYLDLIAHSGQHNALA